MQVKHIPCLDGLRGIAALWVLIGHACILTGRTFPVVGEPDLGVDLFVILSGFLMAFHYTLQADRRPWISPTTWVSFWRRRFFRIAPLYYVLLAMALLMGPLLYDARTIIDTALERSPQLASRFEDSSPSNIILHLTFLFGLIPDYAFRTPLPDWSLGLEMQFYAVFPALMLLGRRLGWTAGSLLICGASVAAAGLLAKYGIRFPMPSFLPLKMPFFLVGMLCALAVGRDTRTTICFFALSLFFAAIPLIDHDASKTLIRLIIVTVFFALIHHRHLGSVGKAVAAGSDSLGTRPFRVLGDLSFGTYLWHLLIMQPVAASVFLAAPELGRSARFVLVLAVVIPVTYTLAYLTFHAVELPGQSLGKKARVRGMSEADAS